MVRHIRLRYDWLSHHHILTEEIVKRRVREPVGAGMRDPLLEGKFFKDVAKPISAQSVQRLLCGEHRLIVVCIEIPSNNEPIYRRDFRSDEVAIRILAGSGDCPSAEPTTRNATRASNTRFTRQRSLAGQPFKRKTFHQTHEHRGDLKEP
jgi:hypothetical protein